MKDVEMATSTPHPLQDMKITLSSLSVLSALISFAFGASPFELLRRQDGDSGDGGCDPCDEYVFPLLPVSLIFS